MYIVGESHGRYSSFNLKQEEAAREEEQALEKIAAILAALTSKRTARVSWHYYYYYFGFILLYLSIVSDFENVYFRSQRHQEICRTQA